MIKDTIYNLDTIILDKSNEYLTRKEVIELFENVQSFHQNEYSNFFSHLIIFITILGFLVAFISFRRISSIEERVIRESGNNESRLNRQVDQLKNDISKFQGQINGQIENTVNIEVQKLNNSILNTQSILYEDIQKEIEKLRNKLLSVIYYHQAHTTVSKGIDREDENLFKSGIKGLVTSLYFSVVSEEFVMLEKLLYMFNVVYISKQKIDSDEMDTLLDLDFYDIYLRVKKTEIENENYKANLQDIIKLLDEIVIKK